MGEDVVTQRPIDMVWVRYLDPRRHSGQRQYAGALLVSYDLAAYGVRELPGVEVVDAVGLRPCCGGVWVQPLEFDGVEGLGAWRHVPDVFARSADGGSWLLDVKDPSQFDSAKVRLQRERTARVCERLGWNYQMVGEPPQQWANVSWLSGYRRKPNLGAELIPRLITLARQPVAIGDLLGFMQYLDLARAVLLHLCWLQRIVFDLDAPLRETTVVVVREEWGEAPAMNPDNDVRPDAVGVRCAPPTSGAVHPPCSS